MNEFNRGIQNYKFINALNDLYNDRDSFWHKMVEDKDLFIAIRKEYINVYYKGQSLCRLEYKNYVRGATHKKYLGVNKPGYFYSNDGIFSTVISEVISLTEIAQLKQNITKHIGKEKKESYTVILNNEKCIIDVEIALVKRLIDNPVKKSDYKISSIDYVALESTEGKNPRLVFYEAKHATNSEIKSSTTPKVFEQISRYKDALHQHEKEIIASYKIVIKNLKDLHILSQRNMPDIDLVTNNLVIDFEPKLIVFGTDKHNIDNEPFFTLKKLFGKNLELK